MHSFTNYRIKRFSIRTNSLNPYCLINMERSSRSSKVSSFNVPPDLSSFVLNRPKLMAWGSSDCSDNIESQLLKL